MWRADIRLRISGVIQGVGEVPEDLLGLVRRGRDHRVVSEGLRKISRADRASSWEGLYMRGLELRSLMKFG